MKFKTDLANFVYLNSSLPKASISAEKLLEIIEAFCVRNNCNCLEINTQDQITLVTVDAEETLLLHDDWQKSFIDMGYEAPLIEGV